MIQGSIVAIVTPMAGDGAIDYEALRHLLEFHIEQGTDAVVPSGTTGESATLTMQEHFEIVERVIEYVAGRIPVIAGTGSNATAEAIEFTRHAADSGADACLLISPYYNKPTQEGLYQHHKAIAQAVPIPQILYNVPGRTACDMQTETVQRLSEIDTIIGIKEASGSIERGREIMQQCSDDFLLFSGEDHNAAEMIFAGGKGVISVTANVAPQKMHAMCEAALAGDRDQAAAIDKQLAGLHEMLFIESNPIPCKWALHQMGLISAGLRLPLTPLSESCHKSVYAAMQQAGVI